ncbi:MAG: hypothetical protein ABIJ21_06550 [Nanoarchaeota archaeon]
MEGKLTRIGPVSYGKIMMPGMALFGLIYGLIMAIVVNFGGGTGTEVTGFEPLASLSWGLIIVFPILYGIIGFLMGVCTAAVYNLLASWVGGIVVKIE